jgi:hypothetical protein
MGCGLHSRSYREAVTILYRLDNPQQQMCAIALPRGIDGCPNREYCQVKPRICHVKPPELRGESPAADDPTARISLATVTDYFRTCNPMPTLGAHAYHNSDEPVHRKAQLINILAGL